ncbi:MAG: 1-deoxy-D-xylulose-5-phosphate reductoisomerase [Clostridia bacterium]|nr:1-deoxy-D-xylulose-5-phosphate reductoisomerase [Clostridia bacterium]
MKNYNDTVVTILGSTGSVGTQAVCVAREMGVKVGVLAAGRNYKLLAEQAAELSPAVLSVSDDATAEKLRELTGGKYEIIVGADALESAILGTHHDVIIHSIAGLEGTRSALAAAKTGAKIGMANKEAIIAAGGLINRELSKSGGVMVPVDSEHSAIFQCLRCGSENAAHPDTISRILLTASGGPFFGKSFDELRDVTPERALAHPTWKMGPKITVDSATLMNKGFEVMEAVRLFGVTPDKVEVLIHRQSIIHSMVEYIDNSVIAQLAAPDMRSCIRYAISYPERAVAPYGKLDFPAIAKLTFDAPDTEAFPLLSTAYRAIEADGVMPSSLIAADEVAVDAFLKGRIGFCDIVRVIDETLAKTVQGAITTDGDVYEAVARAKSTASRVVTSII